MLRFLEVDLRTSLEPVREVQIQVQDPDSGPDSGPGSSISDPSISDLI